MRRRSFSIKWHVAILGVLIFAPLLAVQGILSYRIASSEREALENSVTALAREISDVIDRDLRAAQSTLLALGTAFHVFDALQGVAFQTLRGYKVATAPMAYAPGAPAAT